MLAGLQSSEYAALHITTHRNATVMQKTVEFLRDHIVPIHYAVNVIKRRPFNTPSMRMHRYDLDRVCRLFYGNGFTDLTLYHTDHGGYIGAMTIARRVV